ncbi:ubiquinol-cytochrome c reductase iron-sulfur subunit [Thermomonas sp.]|jgi:ubiquinol-cytochrome c reductase iron-sulfur subunit|uniref:ubiquinol-cytochrome c reductase iron-sulfur subunit n=1 Tax=Thermomonas sp. TaxID=1971895 RepID=UPI002487DC59|nr:ubiquinol-cytochrome c reductase iron-sulfur subunit [Thermomonas sp.]MDI1252494.1 ubiquinol-cytochrome c reductase iron-sulfur subunit [Thermomonas sp.]
MTDLALPTTRTWDPQRRRWIAATAVTGCAGLAATTVPFLASFAPSERARAIGAPVKVQLQGLGTGELKTVEWRGKPVFVLKRSHEMLESLVRNDALLLDPHLKRGNEPEYARNALRSVKPEVLVLVGICTHLGCIPSFRPTPATSDLGASWPGGFYCPCHGSKFDLAGRVFKNVPAPTNLEVPPYRFMDETMLLIG